jgi:hypothetical protein
MALLGLTLLLLSNSSFAEMGKDLPMIAQVVFLLWR